MIAAALTSPSNGRGGSYRLDDHDVHGNHLVASTLKAQRGKAGGGISHEETLVAAPLTQGSATGKGVNAPGRRQEDDENLVAQAFQWHLDTGTIGTHHHSPTLDKANPPAMVEGASVRRLTPTECERLQALPDGWTRLDDSTPDSRRYAALGDAVTASIGFWIGCRIRDAA